MPLDGVQVAQAFAGGTHGFDFFGEAKTCQLRRIGIDIKRGDGDGRHAELAHQPAAEGAHIADAQRFGVDADEVRSGGVDERQPGLGQDVPQDDAARAILVDELGVVAVALGLHQGHCRGVLHRGRSGEGDPLVTGTQCAVEGSRGNCPADLPACHAEGFADAVEADGALPHVGEAGQVDVDVLVIDQAVIDLVDDGQDVVGFAQIGDLGQFGQTKDLAGRVVGCVEQEQFGLLGTGSCQHLGVVVPDRVGGGGWVQAHGDDAATGHDDVGHIGVVGGFEDDHCVAGIDERQHHVAQELGCTAGDADLGERIDVHPGTATPHGGDRLTQTNGTRHGSVLVVVGLDGLDSGVFDKVGTGEVGEALTEVDGVVLDCQGAHLGENRRSEARDAGCRCRMTHRYSRVVIDVALL